MVLPILDNLLILQFGDSAFPSGAFTFSWGLEELAADGLVSSKQDVIEIIEDHLVRRWRCMDRVFLSRAYAGRDEASIADVDRVAEATSVSAQMRTGSRRAGRRLLNICAQLGFPRAQAYQERVRKSEALGHLPVVQGLVFGEVGLTLVGAELISVWGVVSGLVAASVRLGIVGHIEAQQILTHHRATIERIVMDPPDVNARPGSFTPLIDIALARGEERNIRIFTN